MAYVDKKDYEALSGHTMDDAEYSCKSAYADAYIDSITLDRVGKAVANGEDLPQQVKLVYTLIIDDIDTVTNMGDRVSSFSNGEDSYSFDVSEDSAARIYATAATLLPVEWISACVSYEGGNYAC